MTTLAGTAEVSGGNDGIGGAAQFNYPCAIALDQAGILYVADTANNTIRQITPQVAAGQTNWIVTTIAGSAGISDSADGPGSAARFSGPSGIAADRAGNVYVADTSNNTLRKLQPGSSTGQGQWTVTTLGGLAGVYGAADGLGGTARFDSPAGIALDTTGKLYVADNHNNTIRLGVSPPYILLGTPAIANGRIQIPFSLLSGAAGAFYLLNANAPGGTWATNSAAVLSTNAPGTSYTFSAPLPNAAAQFYRVMRPY